MIDSNTESTSAPAHTAFAEDVRIGLSGNPKTLPSKYFYDETGDKIFQEIMNMEEYYLTGAEYDILRRHKQNILSAIEGHSGAFRLLELGAGNGYKTKILLDYFVSSGVDFYYYPIDISQNVLDVLRQNVSNGLAGLSISPLCGDYLDVLSKMDNDGDMKNIVLFLGSNIGNFNDAQVVGFLKQLHASLNRGDMLLVGFDLRKNPEIILRAYNDRNGITKRFNINLLNRINKELGADIDVAAFEHYPVYNPATGECKSYLISTAYQTFRIEALRKRYELEAWEPIFTEISKKYSNREIHQLCEDNGFKRVADFYDAHNYFADSLWQVV